MAAIDARPQSWSAQLVVPSVRKVVRRSAQQLLSSPLAPAVATVANDASLGCGCIGLARAAAAVFGCGILGGLARAS